MTDALWERVPGLGDAARHQLARWLSEPAFSAFQPALAEMAQRAAGGDDSARAELDDAFAGPLPIGTGGRRGKCGAGPNRMNAIVVRETAQGLADAMRAAGDPLEVVVVYDTRASSREFAHLAAAQLMANGVAVVVVDEPRPTPQLSFLVRERGAGAGLVVSASHNPPEDNGLKIYGPDGAQVLGRRDETLMAAIERVIADPAAMRPLPPERAEVAKLDVAKVDAAYHAHVLAQGVVQGDLAGSGLRVVYTPLHGVGHTAVVPVLRARGLDVATVPEQVDADEGRFSTVKSANPEDPNAFAMALALAGEDADLVIANDPDADRLGAFARDAAGELRFMDGNRLGALLLDHVLRHADPKSGVVATTLVTTGLIAAQAEAAGVKCVSDLLVGFKHHAGLLEEQGASALFACEESHGYLRGGGVRDKDGAMAALLLAECAAEAKSAGQTLFARLDELWARHGYHRERTANLRAEGAAGRTAIAALMRAWRESPPTRMGAMDCELAFDRQGGQSTGSPTRDLPGNVLGFALRSDEVRCTLVVRPSGTEPKAKLYALVSGPADAADAVDATTSAILDAAVASAREIMAPHLQRNG